MTIPLVVYGSLRTGLALPYQPADFEELLGARQPCLIAGQLIDLGAYPGLVDADDPQATVIGELCQLPNEGVLARFDAYESYDPEDLRGSQYLRQWVRLRSPEVQAWTYIYNQAWDPSMIVASGDWADRDG